MPLNPAVKASWIKLQKEHPYPVNAIGCRIASNDYKTLKIWREEGINQFVESEQADGKVSSDPLGFISTFTDWLVEELGARGFGRHNLLQVVEHRLLRLRVKYPCLEGVTVVNDRVDFSPLASSSANIAEIVNAWGELIREIHQSGVDNLGQKIADEKYHYVRDALYQQDPSLFDHLALNDVLP